MKKIEKKKNGSALLLTILVVSLLLVIVLSMVAFIRLKTREVTNRQNTTIAQLHAKLAVNVAVARLQSLAGADARTTATAAILDSDPSTLAVDTVNHSNWTGVWQKTDPESRSHDPDFLGWLVSLTSASTEQITAAESTTLDPNTKIELVSSGTVDTLSDHVAAERITIPDPDAPTQAFGSYAFWIGDEGAKASLAMTDPWVDSPNLQPSIWSQATAHRTGVEALPAFSATQADEPILLTASTQIDRLVDLESLQLIDSSFQNAVKDHFHDVTFSSYGIMADSRRGGLKRDLSLAFEKPDTAFNSLDDDGDGVPDFADSGERNQSFSGAWDEGFDLGYLFALEGKNSQAHGGAKPDNPANPEAADWSSSNLKTRGPTWHRLRSHYRLYKDWQSLSSGDPLPARPLYPTPWLDADNPGSRFESPALTYMTTKEYDPRNLQSVSSFYAHSTPNLDVNILHPTKTTLAPQLIRIMTVFSLARESNGSGSGNVRLVANTMLVIANPYDVPIEFRGFKTSFTQLPFAEFSLRREDSVHGDETVTITNMYHWLRMLTDQESQNDISMNVIATSDGSDSPGNRMVIQPGQAIVFSNEGDPLDYGEGTTGGIGLPSGPDYEEDAGIYFTEFGENVVFQMPLHSSGRLWVKFDLNPFWRTNLYLTPDNLNSSSNSWGNGQTEDGPLQSLVFPIGEVSPSGGRVIGGLTGDFYTGLELGTSLQDKIPLFYLDARLKPFSSDAALLVSQNPRTIADSSRFLDGESTHWETELREINSFNEIDLDIDLGAGDNSAYWGAGYKVADGQKRVKLFEVPRAPLLSLAELAHANIANFNSDPAYALGNSFAHPLISSEHLHHYLNPPGSKDNFSAIDLSYLGNEALWDTYYFSSLVARQDLGETLEETITAFQTGTRNLPNSRMVYAPDVRADISRVSSDLLNHRAAAAHLLQRGAFNVNSTSVPAWQAVLSGHRDRTIIAMENDSAVEAEIENVLFSRLIFPENNPDDFYQGYLELTDAQIQSLAEEIVTEVKTRGPFLSLSDFVNRRLVSGPEGKMGPLQAAITQTDINDRLPQQSPDSGLLPEPDHQPEFAAIGLPGSLLQSDLLRQIGPGLSTRSDTFKIRTYGDVRSGQSNQVSARVWCEALVQRIPEPLEALDPDMSSGSLDNYAPANSFGRRFRVVWIKYLSEDEI